MWLALIDHVSAIGDLMSPGISGLVLQKSLLLNSVTMQSGGWSRIGHWQKNVHILEKEMLLPAVSTRTLDMGKESWISGLAELPAECIYLGDAC